jgi:ATP-dependent DNA helicase RecG
MNDLADIISKIQNPLLYASKNNFTNLDKVKDLELCVHTQSKSALELELDLPLKNIFEHLSSLFDQFDSLNNEQKRERIEDALSVLEQVDIEVSNSHERRLQQGKPLSTSIQYIKGVGPKISQMLAKKGVHTILDALYFLPRKYEDRRTIKKIGACMPGRTEIIRGTISMIGVVPYRRGRKRVLEMAVNDGSGVIIAKWFHFNERYMRQRFKRDQLVIMTGEVKRYNLQKEVHHPEIEIIDPKEEESWEFKRIIPIYSETEGLYQKTMRRIMKKVVDEHAFSVVDGMPAPILARLKLMPLEDAVRSVHFPGDDVSIDKLNKGDSAAHRRLIFDEFFFLELGLALRKRNVSLENGNAYLLTDTYAKKLKKILPFELTDAQKRVVKEIIYDLKKPHPMNRLLQGDVGSGKTIVALIASLIVIENGFQAAFMAPTEILAEQHFSTISPISEKLGLKLVLLTSSTKGSKRTGLYQKIAEGEVDIVIGTHAIIQESVRFKRLGLAIIDEQHRFGVMQRAMLKKKGMTPDVLVMTATPIPRTLGLTVYGDLDSSVIDQMPPGRIPVKTKLYHERNRDTVYKRITQEVENGKQVFIVYPLIEESEKMDLMNASHMAEHLQKEVFPRYTIGLLHGKVDAKEKERIMSDFQAKKIDILVSTTVVEVGIDVPNASLMVIEHAERFGLSQLHQLRGRVGRSDYPSQCILLAQYSKSDDARQRLKIMEQTTDGFKVAEEDFAIRGPGEFLGTRQSGIPDFRIANIIKDAKILSEARQEAFKVVERDPELEQEENKVTKQVLRERWKGRLELASIG